MTAQRSSIDNSPFQAGITEPFDLNGSTRPPSLTRQTQKFPAISATIFPSVRSAGLSGRLIEPGPFPSPFSPWQSAHLAVKISLPFAIILGSVHTWAGTWELAYAAGTAGCSWSPCPPLACLWPGGPAFGALAGGCCACALRSANPASHVADTTTPTIATTTAARVRVTESSCVGTDSRPRRIVPGTDFEIGGANRLRRREN